MASPNVSEIVTTTIDQMASIVHGMIGKRLRYKQLIA